jgi:uncharacterized protein YbjQ (UPF0145 family)
VLITTTHTLEGKRITRYFGLVSGEAFLEAAPLGGLFSSNRAYEGELRKAREFVLNEIADQSRQLDANAVIAVDLDYEEFRQGTMLMASASGTAVQYE